MGYDMYVCDDQGNTIGPSGMELFGSDYYLRRNIWGMGPLREIMLDIGMVYYAANPTTGDDFPDWPGDEHFDEDFEPLTEEARLYRKQQREVLRRTGDERPGIPMHKLCDNSGWWVTKAECVSALALWREKGQPELGWPPEDNCDVIPFLCRAADNGGFRVY